MIILIFVGTLLLICGAFNLAIRRGVKHLRCTRSFSKPAFFEGEEGELIEVVGNDRPYIIPWLRLESRISPYLRFGRQDNLHVSGEMYHCSMFTMMPYQQIRRRHRVRFLRRGSYNLGNASLTAGDMLGISHIQRLQELHVPVLVYPRLLEPENIPTPISRVLGDIVRERQLLHDPFLVRGLRPYQPGDPVRDIHWPATARTGEVQLRVHDYTAQTQLLVVLNGQIEDIQWHNHLSEMDTGTMEYGISLAATLCIRGLREGLTVGFAANMPLDDSQTSTVMLPAEGAAREEEMLAAFARLKVVRTQNFPAFLDTLQTYSGFDILVLSHYDSENIQLSLQGLRQSGNQVAFHLFQGGNP